VRRKIQQEAGGKIEHALEQAGCPVGRLTYAYVGQVLLGLVSAYHKTQGLDVHAALAQGVQDVSEAAATVELTPQEQQALDVVAVLLWYFVQTHAALPTAGVMRDAPSNKTEALATFAGPPGGVVTLVPLGTPAAEGEPVAASAPRRQPCIPDTEMSPEVREITRCLCESVLCQIQPRVKAASSTFQRVSEILELLCRPPGRNAEH
jgi:hypothetical protein